LATAVALYGIAAVGAKVERAPTAISIEMIPPVDDM